MLLNLSSLSTHVHPTRLTVYVIPAISACIINTIFSMMTWLDLDSLGQNNKPSDWTFFQSIASFHWPIDCYFPPIDCIFCPSHCHFLGKRFPVTGLANRLPLYSKRLPLCLGRHHQAIAFLSKRLLTLSKRLLAIRCHQAIATFWASDWLLAETNSQVFMGFRHLSTP